MAKAQSHRPPDLLRRHPREDGERENRGDTAQEANPVRGVCGSRGGHETADARDVRGTRGGCGFRGGTRERMDGVSSGRPPSFRHPPRQVDDRSPGRGGMAQDGKTRGNFFMTKWIAAERARAALRHAVICPNVTERTKERVAQSKRARTGLLATVD